MPANMAQCARVIRWLSAGITPFDQNKCRHLRVSDNREAADVTGIGRRYMYRSTEFFHPVGGAVHVVNADITDPLRPDASFLRVQRHVGQSAG